MVQKTDLEFVKKFKEKLGKLIVLKRLILFGSRATGEMHKWSDFDLMIVSDDFNGKQFHERGRGFHEEWGYVYPVDFVCYTPEEFESLKNRPTIVKEAINNGVEI